MTFRDISQDASNESDSDAFAQTFVDASSVTISETFHDTLSDASQ